MLSDDNMGYTIKVKYGNTIRRITLETLTSGRSEVFSMRKLERKIREVLQIDPGAQLLLQYTDEDNDMVMLENDLDLKDALLIQGLYPLKVTVTLVAPKSSRSMPARESNENQKKWATSESFPPPEELIGWVKNAVNEGRMKVMMRSFSSSQITKEVKDVLSGIAALLGNREPQAGTSAAAPSQSKH